eukprot:scaffold516_cov307-Pavlova_lutheri.AAC.4
MHGFSPCFPPWYFPHRDVIGSVSGQRLIEESVREVSTSASEFECTGSQADVGCECEVGEYEQQDKDDHQVSSFVFLFFRRGCRLGFGRWFRRGWRWRWRCGWFRFGFWRRSFLRQRFFDPPPRSLHFHRNCTCGLSSLHPQHDAQQHRHHPCGRVEASWTRTDTSHRVFRCPSLSPTRAPPDPP